MLAIKQFTDVYGN